MPVQLREPYFLRGRKDVTQRAVIMSLALGSLACVAGWIVAAVQTVAESTIDGTWRDLPVLAGWSASVTLLIFAPLNFWNSRSQLWTLLALPGSFGALSAAYAWMSYTNGWAGEALAVFGYMLLIMLGNGLLLLRATKLHRLALLVSLAGAVFPTGIAMLMESEHFSIVFERSVLPPELTAAGVYATYVGAIVVVLSVPWGIPFWWPPDADKPVATNGK